MCTNPFPSSMTVEMKLLQEVIIVLEAVSPLKSFFVILETVSPIKSFFIGQVVSMMMSSFCHFFIHS